MFWFFRLQLRRAYDSSYDSHFWFSLGHKVSYDSDYNSNFGTQALEISVSTIISCMFFYKCRDCGRKNVNLLNLHASWPSQFIWNKQLQNSLPDGRHLKSNTYTRYLMFYQLICLLMWTILLFLILTESLVKGDSKRRPIYINFSDILWSHFYLWTGAEMCY